MNLEGSVIGNRYKIQEKIGNGGMATMLCFITSDAVIDKKALQKMTSDIVVDGEFMIDRKNLKINFRGSDNQRIIDVKKTLDAGEIVHWEREIQ